MELNKIAAAILLAGLIGMVTGKAAGFLYGGSEEAHHGHGKHEVARGYQIEVDEAALNAGPAEKKEKKLASIIPLLASADVASGEKYFAKKCALCHTHEQGGANKTGPNLWGIVDRAKAAADGFNYSKALAGKGGQWGYDELNGFLHKPKKWLPGTIMAYAGTKKEQDRADLIAYLRSLSNAPAPIPAVADVDVDVVEPDSVPTPAAEETVE